jgi:hypothetical protein
MLGQIDIRRKMETTKTYNEDQMKEAFWKVFHKSGENFFPYHGDEEHCQDVTTFYWKEFVEYLEDKNGNHKTR